MANHLYGYNPTYGGPGALTLSSAYTSRSANDPYLPETLLPSRYLTASDHHSTDLSNFSPPPGVSSYLLNQKDTQRFPFSDSSTLGMSAANLLSSARLSAVNGSVSAALQLAWPSSEIGVSGSPAVIASLKRHSEALYHQTLLGGHSNTGQTEAWLPSKRPRFEAGMNPPPVYCYPQRPGEKDCAFYMLTRTCKYGDSCKYDHPIWVPEGGIPDWKEMPFSSTDLPPPERPGEPDCPYFMKTQKCKYSSRCKFNHPTNVLGVGSAAAAAVAASLPERPSEPTCSFYMKTGTCKFGVTCKFNHPKGITDLVPVAELALVSSSSDAHVVPPALAHNSKGLPVRPGEPDCSFYMKTGSCKFGTTCRYNHPGISAAAAAAASFAAAAAAAPPLAANGRPPRLLPEQLGLLPIDAAAAAANCGFGVQPQLLPQRPGKIECDYFMKTGMCKFGIRCRFDHPVIGADQQVVKLTPAGLPRRRGVAICPYYLKTATCKYGAACKFDHPPPGEVMALAAAAASSTDGTASSSPSSA